MIKGENFVDFVDCDYYISNDCDSYGCDSICRCSKIEDIHVVSVNVIGMVDYLYEIYFDNSKSSRRNRKIDNVLGDITDDINYYTIDRILRINKVYICDNWNIKICNGYYGEEIEDITLCDDISIKIENELDIAFNILDLSKRIEYLLELEYGYLLDELKDKKYELSIINKSDIIFGSKSQYKKVKDMDLTFYNNLYKSYRGIVIEKDTKYKLVDGYHRCLSTSGKIKVIKLI